MKRTPMKAGSKPLARKTPMARGESRLVAKKPMARGSVALARNSKPMRARSKTNANPRAGKAVLLRLVRGQPCYLLVPGVIVHQLATVVPCHSNQGQHGKGMGIKADDEFTVPGCGLCHAEIDQGNRFTREEKFEIWDRAYARWKPVRDRLLAEKNQPKS
jgi:hypothetical protein